MANIMGVYANCMCVYHTDGLLPHDSCPVGGLIIQHIFLIVYSRLDIPLALSRSNVPFKIGLNYIRRNRTISKRIINWEMIDHTNVEDRAYGCKIEFQTYNCYFTTLDVVLPCRRGKSFMYYTLCSTIMYAKISIEINWLLTSECGGSIGVAGTHLPRQRHHRSKHANPQEWFLSYDIARYDHILHSCSLVRNTANTTSRSSMGNQIKASAEKWGPDHMIMSCTSFTVSCQPYVEPTLIIYKRRGARVG